MIDLNEVKIKLMISNDRTKFLLKFEHANGLEWQDIADLLHRHVEIIDKSLAGDAIDAT